MTRVSVFIDGENLRHTICDLFSPDLFDRRDYLPAKAEWAKLFDDLVGRATDGGGKRVRAYWYVINSVDPYPYVVKTKDHTDAILLDWQTKNEKLLRGCSQWDTLHAGDNIANLKALHTSMWGSREAIKRRFDGFHVVQNGIGQAHKAVEFRRSGAIGYNLLTKKLGAEKTVDVNLSVDMVLMRENYDLALIVSGDQDYVPAVQAAKNSGKHVVNVAFAGHDGTLLPGGARRLNDVTDWSIAVPYDDFRKALGLPKSAPKKS